MEKQDSFDDIMRSKFSKREIPLDEANWEDIKKLTDTAREEKKRRRWIIIFFLGLLCGAIFMLPFIINNSKNNSTENKEKQSKGQMQPTPNEIAINKEEPKNNTVKLSQSESTEDSVKPIAAENNIIENKKDAILAVNKKESNFSSKDKNDVIKKENVIPVVSLKKTKEEITNKISMINRTNTSVTKTDSNDSVILKKEKSEPIIPNSITKQEKTKPIERNEKKNGNSDAINTINKKTEVIGSSSDKTEEKKKEQPESTINPSLAVTENQTPQKDTLLDKPKIITENIPLVNTDSISKTNVIVASKDTSIKKTDSLVKANPWTLSPVLVFNAGYGVQTTGGLETTRALSKYWNAGAGLYYMYYLGAVDGNTARTLTSTNFDFGSSYSTIKISVSKFHYAMLNVFVELKINKRNAFVAGANLFYLVTTSNTITKTYDNYYGGHPIQEQKTYGYTKELSPLVVAIMGGYRRKIFAGLDIGLYINYGLTSMMDKKYATTNYEDNHYHGLQYNTSVQLELKYNLFRKVKK